MLDPPGKGKGHGTSLRTKARLDGTVLAAPQKKVDPALPQATVSGTPVMPDTPIRLSPSSDNPGSMTLTRTDEAAAIFNGGYSCSQAVCAAFAGDFDIDRDVALKLSCGLGGGMAHTGNTCGAVTGALMVIGMKYGRTEIDDLRGKEKTYAVANEFITEFLRRNHSVNCTDLIGCNLSDPKELAAAREKDLFHTKCSFLVRDAGEILEKIL
jgi:C_GCAxxG_C_C family probable redox protein